MGIKKLRGVEAKLAPEEFNNKVLLWRGMRGVELDMAQFKKFGGTELAPMSTTKDRTVAEKYSAGKDSIIFNYDTSGLTTGVSLQFLSVYPKESEYLYPPGTFLTLLHAQKQHGV